MAGLQGKINFSFVKGIQHTLKKKINLYISNQTLPNFNPIFATILVYGLEQVVYIASFNHQMKTVTFTYFTGLNQ